jgi:hypothetical protein
VALFDTSFDVPHFLGTNEFKAYGAQVKQTKPDDPRTVASIPELELCGRRAPSYSNHRARLHHRLAAVAALLSRDKNALFMPMGSVPKAQTARR